MTISTVRIENNAFTSLRARGAGLRVLAAGIGLVLAAQASAEDLGELLRLTRNHPAVAAAEAEAGAARSDITVAEAATKLKVSAGLSSSGYSSEMDTTNQWLSPYVSARKMLYDHGRTEAEVAGRTAAYAARSESVRVQREGINKQVVQLYVSALSNHAAGAVLDEQKAALEKLLEKVSTIVQFDPGRASEASQVESRLASVRASREMRATNEKEALQQISQLLQRDVAAVGDLPNLEKQGLLPDSLVQARQSLESHPELQIARYYRDETDAANRLASKWRQPSWNLDLRVDSPAGNAASDTRWMQGVSLQLSTGLSLLDGGAGSATAQGTAQRRQAAEAGIEKVRRQLRQELERLWAALPMREQQLGSQKNVVEAADRIRRSGEEQFFAGRRPLMDLMTFDSEYFNAQVNYEEQRVQYLASQWLMVAALGKLSEVAEVPLHAASALHPARPSANPGVRNEAPPAPWSPAAAIKPTASAAAVAPAPRVPEPRPAQQASVVASPELKAQARPDTPTGPDARYVEALRNWGATPVAATTAPAPDTHAPSETTTDDDDLRAWPMNR